jgi:asparagine synthase (glutamine-hydrolysing)
MCGIAGFFAYDRSSPPADRGELARVCSRMECRGPDSSGTWFSADGRVALGHRRLAIIDLSPRGAQPMEDSREELQITFNGEIYNYRSLRSELEAKGHQFRSDSDTEVILRLYVEHGPAMVAKLRGMFAFALWDGRKRGLLLARDPFGIKPLYYADTGRVIRVASEVRALLASGAVAGDPEAAGHVGFFLWGHVPEPYTLYRGIRALPAGSTMWISEAGLEPIRPYAAIRDLFTPSSDSASLTTNDAGVLRELLRDSVAHHRVADVDVGVFLSAGIDSGTLTALAAEGGDRLRTVTLGFREFAGTPNDETRLAALVARHYDTKHETVWIAQQDFRDHANRLIERMDQPTVDGVNTYFVAYAARQAGLKVALSGLGGDELFGGYPSFRQIPRMVSLVNRLSTRERIARGIRATVIPALGRWSSPKYAGVMDYGGTVAGAYLLRRALFLPDEISRLLDPEIAREGLETLATLPALEETIRGIESDHLRIIALESSWYMRNQLLRDTDWASMTHSIEVRVPLVDWQLWKGVARMLAAGVTVNKQSLAAAAPRPLPAELLARKKTGFLIPTRRWLIAEYGENYAERGLRGWARFIYDRIAPTPVFSDARGRMASGSHALAVH